MERTYISDTATIGTEGMCVAMYRIKNKTVDMKSVADVRKNNPNFKISKNCLGSIGIII